MFKTSSRPVHGTIILTLLMFSILALHTLKHARRAGDSVTDHYKGVFSKMASVMSKGPKEARRLYPEELMQRPLATDLTKIPKLFHQSWMNSTLPSKFEDWSQSCRKAHPDWEWVLWTDEDNLKMVERFAPWFLNAYEDLSTEIYRADTARNLYMHIFGGVYADLDTECLRPYDSMFERYNSSTVAHGLAPHINEAFDSNTACNAKPSQSGMDSAVALRKPSLAQKERKVFLGRMGTEEGFSHSIPNAWMGSTPGHPFWLLPLQSASDNVDSGAAPEGLTGPVALYAMVDKYNNDFERGEGSKMDDYYADGPWRHLFKAAAKENPVLPPQSIVLLPFWEVYPYSWERDGQMYRHVCWVLDARFNAARCKLLLGLDHRNSHSITYWSHSWSDEGDGHYGKGMELIDDPNKKPDDQKDAGAANAWLKQAEEYDKKKDQK